MIVDVIILSYTEIGVTDILLSKAIETLHKSETTIKFNVIIVESNKEYKHNLQDVTIIVPEGKFNFNKSVTCGVQECVGKEWVVISNNDVEFQPGWFTEILKVKRVNPDIHSFSPWAPGHHENMYVLDKEEIPFILGYQVSTIVCGWCIVFRKELMYKIPDLFDETFPFWYQDDNYARCLARDNIKHALVTGSNVKHLFSQSHSLFENLQESTHGQSGVFSQKWGH